MPFIIRFALIVLVIYLVGRVLLRYVFPLLLQWWLKKIAKRMNPEAFEEMEKQQSRKPQKEGNISIKNIPNKKKDKDSGDDKGEYVDYEEI